MGRRAKQKQGAPDARELDNLISSKKLGKRKANDEDENDAPVTRSERPAKKAKDSSAKREKKEKKPSKKSEKKLTKSASKGKKSKAADSDEGWEDVEDGAELGDDAK